MAKQKDAFSQIGYITVTESAANTLTFNGLSVFSNVLSQRAMIISRLQYQLPNATVVLLTADNDGITFGLTGDDSLTSISLDDPEVYDYNFYSLQHFGTAANGWIWDLPKEKDLSGMPGGGLLVPADRLYGYCQGVNLGSAANIKIRFWYRIIDLSAQEYLELAQAMRVLK